MQFRKLLTCLIVTLVALTSVPRVVLAQYPCNPYGNCWSYGYMTIYGYITPSSGSCVYLSIPNYAGATYVALYNLTGNYPEGYVAVTGYYLRTQGPCSGTGFIVKSINHA